jgi:hypothetical protein
MVRRARRLLCEDTGKYDRAGCTVDLERMWRRRWWLLLGGRGVCGRL